MTIQRRGRSHRAVCDCGWTSHSWNELRPAEADAWHHVYGDEPVIDLTATAEERPKTTTSRPTSPEPTEAARSRAIDHLVRLAQDLAAKPSPYSGYAATDLWRSAGEEPLAVQTAVAEIEELLARHERQSSGAADSEWLQLITAKRLLLQALALGDRPGTRRALL